MASALSSSRNSSSINIITDINIVDRDNSFDIDDNNDNNNDNNNFLENIDESGYQTLNGKMKYDKILQFAILNSWLLNWLLLIVKAICVWLSSSKSVTAALVDSVVDLASQAVLSLADRYIGRHSPDYPVGRSRLEALSVLACASIMIMASIEVIQFSIADIIEGVNGTLPDLQVDIYFYVILGTGIFLKLLLYIYSKWVSLFVASDSLEALIEDHFNDVISNSAAILTASIAFYYRTVWWFDPVGAIVISLVIIGRWISMMGEQVKKIVGHTAPQKFIEEVEDIARKHDIRLAVDCTRAYHFGARYNVEMEIVLPGKMTVMESHDIALALQHKIEGLEDVERAFVHVDHQERDGLEHKIERMLVLGNAQPSPLTAPKENELRQRKNQITEAG